jgi:hypothetical protein
VPGIGAGAAPEDVEAAVGGAVVDEHVLVLERERQQRLVEGAMQLPQALGLVVERDDDGQIHGTSAEIAGRHAP